MPLRLSIGTPIVECGLSANGTIYHLSRHNIKSIGGPRVAADTCFPGNDPGSTSYAMCYRDTRLSIGSTTYVFLNYCVSLVTCSVHSTRSARLTVSRLPLLSSPRIQSLDLRHSASRSLTILARHVVDKRTNTAVGAGTSASLRLSSDTR